MKNEDENKKIKKNKDKKPKEKNKVTKKGDYIVKKNE